ncbi:MAG: prephenate dehydrogenase/arogenate dehydrogenase family protein [Chloroflexi bacterium]|nr:MAG: prephenate dehydrogenase/arogenate dehydrogenase family protein [Chloroflexota bacterium]MBL1193453.1 prephenate dehydrogenase/arogenate dehydrogenase family protein [Chloroflexota bacterium]NOH10744.1 prephenate dehydrogenase/arogenate dehydrogenase family protein [Chloroflexota bacterium]
MSEGEFESDFSLAQADVAIVGLGLMGASLALALRGHCRSLLGVDTDPNIVAIAKDRQVVDQASTQAEDILPQANLIVLAVPVSGILRLIEQLPHLHPGNVLVMDLGSTKVEICSALETLPPRFDVVGGHPMCGKEFGGLQHADAGMFTGSTFAFCELAGTSAGAKRLADQLSQAIGSHSLWLEPQQHDEWTAATSHAPYLVSSALALSTDELVSPLIGSGFESAARLAASQPEVMLDILETNREATLIALSKTRQQIQAFENLLKEDDNTVLKGKLAQAQTKHQILLEARRAQ